MTDYDPTWAVLLDNLTRFVTEVDSHEQDEDFCERLFDEIYDMVKQGHNKLTLDIEKNDESDQVITVLVLVGEKAKRELR